MVPFACAVDERPRRVSSLKSQKTARHWDHERWGETPSSPDYSIGAQGSTESRPTVLLPGHGRVRKRDVPGILASVRQRLCHAWSQQKTDASCASESLSERRTFNIERSTLNSFTATPGFLRCLLFDVRCPMLTCRSRAGSCCCLSSWPRKALPKNRQSFPSASMPIACGSAGPANVSARGLTCGVLTIAAAVTKAPTPVIFFINWPTISTCRWMSPDWEFYISSAAIIGTAARGITKWTALTIPSGKPAPLIRIIRSRIRCSYRKIFSRPRLLGPGQSRKAPI